MPTSRNFDVYLHAENELHPLTFWDIVKILQTCYFEYFRNAWSSSSIMIVLPCQYFAQSIEINLQETFMFIYMEKINFLSNFFLRYCEDIANLLFWELWECLTQPLPKIIVSICRKLSCLSANKKSVSSLISFLRCCEEIANLLFWVIWACLATHT